MAKLKDFTLSYIKQKSVHNRNTLAELYGKLKDTDSALAANAECAYCLAGLKRSSTRCTAAQ